MSKDKPPRGNFYGPKTYSFKIYASDQLSVFCPWGTLKAIHSYLMWYYSFFVEKNTFNNIVENYIIHFMDLYVVFSFNSSIPSKSESLDSESELLINDSYLSKTLLVIITSKIILIRFSIKKCRFERLISFLNVDRIKKHIFFMSTFLKCCHFRILTFDII